MKDNQGKTALHTVGLYGFDLLVVPLLDKGADVNAKDNQGKTALHRAGTRVQINDFWVLDGKQETVKILLEKGAKINATNNDGKTALALAKEAGYDFLEKLLRSRGAIT